MSAGFIAILVLVMLAVVGLIVVAVISAKRKREAMEALATKHGWTLRRKDRSLHQRWDVAPFDFGHARRSDWIFEGELEGQPFTAFQYTCQTTSHNGKSSSEQVHNFRVCILPMPLDGHDLRITKEHIGHKIADALGGEDIDFESDAFSRRFWVQCRDRRFAYDIITPDMMEFLMPHTGWTWQWAGHDLILHQHGGLKPQQVLPKVRLATGFAARLPRHRLATP